MGKPHAAMDRAVLAAYGWGDIVSGEWRVANGEANSSSTLHGIVNPKQPSSTDSRLAELYQWKLWKFPKTSNSLPR